MRKHARWVVLALIPLALAACSMLPVGGVAPEGEAEVLPTTTPDQVLDTPVPTETPPPPPTVTPFPSITPEGGVPPEGETAGETTAGEAGGTTGESTGGTTGGATGGAASNVPGIPSDVPVGQRLYLADFSVGRWPEEDLETVKVEPGLGGYVWQIGPVDVYSLITGKDTWSNFYVQVEANVQRCPQDAGYGFQFRLVDTDNYYQFIVWCNDTYSFFSKLEGVQGPYIPKTELPASVAGRPESLRTIGLLAQGSDYAFYVDGVRVGDFQEGELTSGDIALWTKAGETVFRVVFNNWEVYELK